MPVWPTARSPTLRVKRGATRLTCYSISGSRRTSTPASLAASLMPSTTGSSRWSNTRPGSSRCPMRARIWLCDAGFGLYFLGHWVRERGAFDIAEGVRRLTSHQAGLYGIPDRGRIAVGACADLLLFDPATVGISASRRVNDLPGGGPRTLRDPLGVHGVFVNGVRVFYGADYVRLGKGPGRVLDRFLPARATALACAAQ